MAVTIRIFPNTVILPVLCVVQIIGLPSPPGGYHFTSEKSVINQVSYDFIRWSTGGQIMETSDKFCGVDEIISDNFLGIEIISDNFSGVPNEGEILEV